jgi:hypothetical protein
MDAEKKVKALEILLKEEEFLMREYTKELKRLRMANLRIKLHMEVLVSHPDIKTASELRERYRGDATFKESILHYN